jgi:hypothetical protein
MAEKVDLLELLQASNEPVDEWRPQWGRNVTFKAEKVRINMGRWMRWLMGNKEFKNVPR